MTAWQPIATAPKDGTRILAYYPPFAGTSGDIVTIRWVLWNGEHYWATSPTGDDPTHWQSLPEPPP